MSVEAPESPRPPAVGYVVVAERVPSLVDGRPSMLPAPMLNVVGCDNVLCQFVMGKDHSLSTATALSLDPRVWRAWIRPTT